MERWTAMVFVASGVLLAAGIASVVLAVRTYGFFPSCGIFGNFHACPRSLGTSEGFLGGLAAVAVGVLAGLYGGSRLD